MEIVVLLINIACCFGVASLGSNRRIGYGWALFISFFFSPLIGLIITLCSGKRKVEFDEMEQKE